MEEIEHRARARLWSRDRLHVILTAALIVLLSVSLVTGGDLSTFAQETDQSTPEAGSTVLDSEHSIADVAETANPAVVTVRATLDTGAFEDVFAQPDDPFAQPYPDQGMPEAMVPTSTGSGFIVDEEGHVVTNNHVVAGATAFEVVLADGSVVPATLVGADPYTDVAVLLLDLPEGTSVPGVLPLGDSDAVRVGDQVVAIGTPLGEYPNTVSAGIVSAENRSLDTGYGYLLAGLIQHDAPVYPGSSGGPLINLAGEVIGINTAKAASTLLATDNTDIGFAIAINEVKEVIADLIADGKVSRPYLGIEGRPLQEGHGILAVADGSPADEAGLRRGDIITAVDGQTVDAEHPLANLLLDHAPGDEVTLTVERDGETIEVPVTLGERPADDA